MTCEWCDKRYIGCHSVCEVYLTEKAKRDERSRIIREKKDKEELVTEVRETNFRKSTKTKQREY